MFLTDKYSLIICISLNVLSNGTNGEVCHRLSTSQRPGELLCNGFTDMLRFNGSTYEDIIEISLSKNNITQVNQGSFTGKLNHVLRVYLDNNSLTTVNPNAFYNLPNLEEIDLSGNNISFIDPNAFDSNKNLRIIDLTGNNIQTLNVNTIRHLDDLEEFVLSDNPLDVCDKHTDDTLSYLKTRRIKVLFLRSCENMNFRSFDVNVDADQVKKYSSIISESSSITSKNALPITIVFCFLLLVTIFLSVIIFALWCKILKTESTARNRTISGSYLLNEERLSTGSEDTYGYLKPKVPEFIPQYLKVIDGESVMGCEQNGLLPQIHLPGTSDSTYNGNEINKGHLYEEILNSETYYKNNFNNHQQYNRLDRI